MRIGLIAMSGIRAHDEELLRLGLTLPGFVERSKTIASLPSLGLLTLAGMTPDPHEVAYIEVPELNGLEGLPVDFDLVGISSYSAQIDEAYTLARRYRDAGIPVVLGGPHVSVLPEEALESCDAVVVGHGEPAWLEVLGDGEAQRLGGVYGSLDGPFDFEDAPRPAFDLLDIDHYNRLTVRSHPDHLAPPVHRIRRRQQLRRPAVLARVVAPPVRQRASLVRRDRSVGQRGRATPRADA
jgi:radical SAM superfamily enzyme YgiQ (UPF0313 family)